MTKEITRAIILQELEDKLKLREWEASRFLFDETVVPIYDIGPHLKKTANDFKQVSITTTGGLLIYVVPATEKWTLYRYDVVFMGAGAYTVAGIYTVRDPLVLTDYCYMDLEAGQSASYHVSLPVPVVLDPGDRIYVNIDGFTSTQNLRLYIDFMREVLR